MIVVPFNQHLPQPLLSNINPDTATTYNSNANWYYHFVEKEKQTTINNKKNRRVEITLIFIYFILFRNSILCVIFSICVNINEIVWYVYVPTENMFMLNRYLFFYFLHFSFYFICFPIYRLSTTTAVTMNGDECHILINLTRTSLHFQATTSPNNFFL